MKRFCFSSERRTFLQFSRTPKEIGGAEKPSQNTLRLFNVLVSYPIPTSKTEFAYYHQKLNARLTSQVGERLKIENLRK